MKNGQQPGVYKIDGKQTEKIDLLTQVQQEIERFEELYRSNRPPLKLKSTTVILVDDGIATGSSMRAAVSVLRKMEVRRIVVAVPAGPPATIRRFRNEVEDVVCAHTPESFYAMGAFYEDFSQVTDQEVVDLLRRASLLITARIVKGRNKTKGSIPR